MKKIFLYSLVLILSGCSTSRLVKENTESLTYHYELDLKEYKDDRIKAKLSMGALNTETATFCFPKIVPGIYGAMDFGQYIQDFHAKDENGNELEVHRLDTNCWEIKNVNSIAFIEYEVNDSWEDFDMNLKRGFYRSAASTFKEEVFVLNPNCVLGYFRGFENIPLELLIHKEENLYGATSLKKTSISTSQDKYVANSYQQLVDNPIMYAEPDTTLIQLPNIAIEVACYSTSNEPISKELSNYIKPLLINQTKYLDGKLPVDKYTFILYHHLGNNPQSYMADGLEHAQSTVILLHMPMEIDVIKDIIYGIASHEFFHTLMPLGIHSHEIANYDFNDPKFSRHLWLYEGMTEYFTIHMPIKNGLQTLPEFVEILEKKITDMASYDEKISFTTLSLNPMELQDQYYNVYLEGALLNLCLDIRLRELSKGAYGVQDLVAELIERYGIDKSFEDEKLFDEIIAITGFPELRAFFDQYVIGTDALPLEAELRKVGLRMEKDGIKIIEQLSEEQKMLRKSWIDQ